MLLHYVFIPLQVLKSEQLYKLKTSLKYISILYVIHWLFTNPIVTSMLPWVYRILQKLFHSFWSSVYIWDWQNLVDIFVEVMGNHEDYVLRMN